MELSYDQAISVGIYIYIYIYPIYIYIYELKAESKRDICTSVALLIVAKGYKQPKCPLTDE